MTETRPAIVPPTHGVRFCSEHSRAMGEDMAGTGAFPERKILIRWPKGRWRYSRFAAEGMPPDLLDAIDRVQDAGWSVNLIDRKGETGHRVLLMPDRLAFAPQAGALPALLDAIAAGPEAFAAFKPMPMPARTILVCTHGTHDRCCAKFGFAAYRAIAAEAARRGGFDLWEASHLGGCRFAATIVALPAGRKYGRLAPNAVAEFLAADAEDRPYVPAYRGGPGHDAAQQAAEVIALRATAPTRPHAPATVDERPSDAPARRFTVSVAGYRADVICRPTLAHAYNACTDLAENAPHEGFARWTAELVSLTAETAPSTDRMAEDGERPSGSNRQHVFQGKEIIP